MALKDITLGQYFPGNSFVHRLDPRTKILAVTLYIVALFLAKFFLTYALMFLVLALAVKISQVPLKSLMKGMKPIAFVVVFTAVLNLFYTPGTHVLAKFWIFTLTMEGVYQAYGYSCVTTPWAEFAARAETEETIIYADIDFEYEDSIRDQLPLLKHRRPEIY